MRTFANCCIALFLAAGPLTAQTAAPADTLLDHLIGRWVLRGPMAGQQVTHDVTFEWVLNHEYVRMHEVSRARKAGGTPAYEAIVYIGCDPKTHRYSVLWLDNTEIGEFVPIGHAEAVGDSLPFLFEYSQTDRFHTTFIYNRRSDTWDWQMDNDQAGARRPFARVTLKRK